MSSCLSSSSSSGEFTELLSCVLAGSLTQLYAEVTIQNAEGFDRVTL